MNSSEVSIITMYRLAVFLLFLHIAQSAKILCSFPVPSYSHQISFQPIWKELAVRGHQVTVLTPNPIKDKSLKNLSEMDFHDISYDIIKEYNLSSSGEESIVKHFMTFKDVAKKVMNAHLEKPGLIDIIQNKKAEKYDLIMIELELPHAYMLKYVYNCPLIIATSFPLQYNADELFGNVNHPIISPDIKLPFSKNLTLLQRLFSMVLKVTANIILELFIEDVRETLEHSYGRNFRSEFLSVVSLVLTNVNPVLRPRKPNIPHIIEFTGIHIQPPKPLPNDLQQYLDHSKQGVIYVSLGGMIKSAAIGKNKINLILETFSQLPYNILWKFENKDLPNKPTNVKIQNWFPQLHILRHPNVKLFITQGGLQSLGEAMHTKTPVVTIPFSSDQHRNSQKVIDIGIGLSIQYSKMTVDKFRDVILEALSERFVQRAEELFYIVTDQPVPALNKTVW